MKTVITVEWKVRQAPRQLTADSKGFTLFLEFESNAWRKSPKFDTGKEWCDRRWKLYQEIRRQNFCYILTYFWHPKEK